MGISRKLFRLRDISYALRYPVSQYPESVLHVSPPHLTKSLISCGLDPNLHSSGGYTPLVWIVGAAAGCARFTHELGASELAEEARVLINSRGRFAKTRKWTLQAVKKLDAELNHQMDILLKEQNHTLLRKTALALRF